ncbi:PIN domain-containing protein [Caldanaerobacter subterraneus KAk]|uniref:PIN domain-containing protein n=1 Tax=Caldanaerobacter subterraneus TaxID=911092 RepID=UPI0032C20A74
MIKEIDSMKNLQNEVGRNARLVGRILDRLREKGKLNEGVPLENGGLIKIELNHIANETVKEHFLETANDNRILAVALNLFHEEQKKENPMPVILVSKDVIMRVKADTLGIPSQDYLSDKIKNYDALYTGFITVFVHPSTIDSFYTEKHLPKSQVPELKEAIDIYPNQFVIFKDSFGSNKSAVARYNKYTDSFEHLYSPESVWDVSPRNVQQRQTQILKM